MAQAELTNSDVATALGVSTRTVVNWISRSNPTMPIDRMVETLRRLLPGYSEQGDPVEIALRGADLAPWRQAALVAEYQRHLHEQALEDTRLGAQ
jgi:hypothetical protein